MRAVCKTRACRVVALQLPAPTRPGAPTYPPNPPTTATTIPCPQDALLLPGSVPSVGVPLPSHPGRPAGAGCRPAVPAGGAAACSCVLFICFRESCCKRSNLLALDADLLSDWPARASRPLLCSTCLCPFYVPPLPLGAAPVQVERPFFESQLEPLMRKQGYEVRSAA